MYLDADKKDQQALAAIDSHGVHISYGDLTRFSERMGTLPLYRSVVFCMCENDVGALAGYYSFVENKAVPLLLPRNMEQELLSELVRVYRPAYVWCHSQCREKFDGECVFEGFGYSLVRTSYELYPVCDELSILMTTSGSTGSPKLVRHSYKNISSSPRNVAAFFEISAEDRAMADLPMHYTMGLSVICSHLYAGATVLLTPFSLMDPRYWDFFKEHCPTTFTGVPYSFEVLRKLRFTRSGWPRVKTLSQGGGKLSEETYLEFANYAHKTGKRFISTYGMTECTARMAYLPWEFAHKKVGSIGRAIPEGELFLVDDDCAEIAEAEADGEVGYRGPNVALGYAQCREDLEKGDEWQGEILTGDMARRDADGFYFVTGRKSRFLKLFGYRVSLEQCEKLVANAFGIECACVGSDERMVVYITDAGCAGQVPSFLSGRTGIHHTAFEVRAIDSLPRNEAGKIQYQLLNGFL